MAYIYIHTHINIYVYIYIGLPCIEQNMSVPKAKKN